MNRKDRRKLARILNDDPDTQVPVFCDRVCLERVGPERLRYLLKAKNIEPVRRHRDNKIVELQVRPFSYKDGEGLPSQGGNASTESHHRENATNPPRCWTFRRRKAS
jgi:hypothetical protein